MSKKVYFPNLSRTRKAKGYTQKDMAMLLNYKSESRYAMYESGDRIPSVLEALRIANVLGATVEYLFFIGEKQTENEEVV